MNDWVKVYQTSDRISVEMVKLALEKNQIEAVCLNKQDSSYLFGNIEIYVPKSKFQSAIEIVISHDL
jgi:hypothetical protein